MRSRKQQREEDFEIAETIREEKTKKRGGSRDVQTQSEKDYQLKHTEAHSFEIEEWDSELEAYKVCKKYLRDFKLDMFVVEKEPVVKLPLKVNLSK